jgi:hypothetical protein
MADLQPWEMNWDSATGGDQQQASGGDSEPWNMNWEQGPIDKAVSAVGGVAKDVGNWVSGSNTDPSIPTFDPTADLNLTAAQKAKISALVLTSFDDERLQKGIKNIVPNAKTSKDSFGNLVVTVDGKSFYPNPSGLDKPTFAQGGAAALAALALKKPISAIGLPVEGILGAATTGGIEAGLAEGVSSTIANEPYQISQPVSGLIGGPIGFGIGLGAQAAMKKGANFIGKLVDAFKVAPNSVADTATQQLTPAAQKAAAEAGLNPDEITIDFWKAVRAMNEEGVPQGQAVTYQQSQQLPSPIPMTRGEVTGVASQQLAESEAEKGARGSIAEQNMRMMRERQQQAVQENIPAMQERIGQGSPLIGYGESGAGAQASLVAKKEAQKTEVNRLYEAARKSGSTFVDPEQAKSLIDPIEAAVKTEFSPITAPQAFSLFDQLKSKIEVGDSIENLFQFRSVISGLAKTGMGPERGAAGSMLRAFDESIVNQANQKMLYGNPESVSKWLDAISQFKDYKNTWEAKGILKKLTSKDMIDGELRLTVPPEAASNAILGVGMASITSRPELTSTLMTLSKNLPKDQWDQIRQEVFLRIADMGARSGKEGSFTGLTFAKSWNDIKKKNPSLVKALFSKPEMELINNFGATVARIGSATKNTSNSSAAAIGYIQRIASMLGTTNMGYFLARVPAIKGITEAAGAISTNPNRAPYTKPMSALSRGLAGVGGATTSPEGLNDLSQLMGLGNWGENK